MSGEFLEYLISQGIITKPQSERVRGLVSKVREPIGSIAFSYGLLSGEDVDLVLNEQRRGHRQFGEIAQALGILTRAQVEALVRVQHVRSAVEVAEALIVSGLLAPESAFQALGRYLTQEAGAETRAAA